MRRHAPRQTTAFCPRVVDWLLEIEAHQLRRASHRPFAPAREQARTAMAKVTIQDVAREAGVSLGTVSNSINHPNKVKAATREAVRQAMDRLGFMPNQSARMLAGGSNASFGLVLPRLDHGFSLQIANGAHSEARRHGYGLLIANADNDEMLETDYLRYFTGTQMAGVLVQPLATGDWKPYSEILPIPTVYLDTHSDQPGYFVAADNLAQGELIADHAISCGARRVSVVGTTQYKQLALRVEGIKRVALAHPDVAFDFLDEGEWNLARDGFMIAQRLATLAPDQRPNFILALTDVLATGVIAGILDAGLSVPGDIAVAGCDGNPLAWSGSVPLTTCAPPGYEIGRRGVQFLIEQIKRRRALTSGEATPDQFEDEDPCHQTMIRPFLLARQSTVAQTNHQQSAESSLNLGTYL